MTVQLDSIYRTKGHYDVVVLDEYCSLQDSFVNPTMKNNSLVLFVFQTQISFAKHVILCDADIVDDKINLVEQIRDSKFYKIIYSYKTAKVIINTKLNFK